MIWHIFKKDVQLLWPLALSVVGLQALCAALTWLMGYFDEPAQVAAITHILPDVVYLGVVLLGVVAVHQEPLETVRADWLVRPMSRTDVLLSKVLSMVLMIIVPILLLDLTLQLLLHFSLSSSIGVAATRSLGLLIFVCLPALVLGALTRSLLAAFAVGAVGAITFGCFFVLFLTILQPGLAASLGGQTWINGACGGVLLTIGAAVTLALQYSTRRTVAARVIGLATMSAALCAMVLLPKDSALAIQKWLWGKSNDSDITLKFYSGAPRAGGVSANVGSPYGAAPMAGPQGETEEIADVRLPLRVSGMHPGDVLFADQAAVRITAMSGSVLYQGEGICVRERVNLLGIGCRHETLEIWATPQVTSSEQRLYLPIGVYERIKDQPVRVDITYDLTRFAQQPSEDIEATGGVRWLSELGSCATRINNRGDQVEVGCLTNIGIPSCIAGVLEDPKTNTRNPQLHECIPNYAPFRRNDPFGAAVSHLRLLIPFRDPSELAHYPVGSAMIERARIMLTTYHPVEHFHRTLVIPRIQLGAWGLQSKAGSELD
jgi:hypothetical protein